MRCRALPAGSFPAVIRLASLACLLPACCADYLQEGVLTWTEGAGPSSFSPAAPLAGHPSSTELLQPGQQLAQQQLQAWQRQGSVPLAGGAASGAGGSSLLHTPAVAGQQHDSKRRRLEDSATEPQLLGLLPPGLAAGLPGLALSPDCLAAASRGDESGGSLTGVIRLAGGNRWQAYLRSGSSSPVHHYCRRYCPADCCCSALSIDSALSNARLGL